MGGADYPDERVAVERVTLVERIGQLERQRLEHDKLLAVRADEADAFRMRLDRLEQETGLLERPKRT